MCDTRFDDPKNNRCNHSCNELLYMSRLRLQESVAKTVSNVTLDAGGVSESEFDSDRLDVRSSNSDNGASSELALTRSPVALSSESDLGMLV